MKRTAGRRRPAIYPIIVGMAAMAMATTETDFETGLVKAGAWQEVHMHCGGCHSLSLVTSQRGDLATWRDTVLHMQEAHNMHHLQPETETRILEYLAEHYAPATRSHRRAPLPSALLPNPRTESRLRSGPGPRPAVEPLLIGRCVPARPPPRH